VPLIHRVVGAAPSPVAVPSRVGRVRAFVEHDIPQVASLHQTVFRTGGPTNSPRLDEYHAYFTRVFLENPAGDPVVSSLVYEEDGGQIVGFLGVVPRRMSMNGQPLRAAISSQLVVDPARRTSLVTARLAKVFLDGPQDLSIADEATDGARRIWEGFGGMTALLYSLHWTRPLRPAWLARSFLWTRAPLAPVAVMAGPFARVVDALATRLPSSPFYLSRPGVSAADRGEETFQACLAECGAVASLRVEHDARTLRWLRERARQRSAGGRLETIVIKDGRTILGGYAYDLDERGVADVLQIAAQPAAIHDVLDHLFWQTWRQGAYAVTGRLEPRFLQALSDRYCLFHRRGPWMLVKARTPELLEPFLRGDAGMSRLDGEWCLRF
jgi:hypothetical protein